MSHSSHRQLYLEALEARCLLSITVFPLPQGQFSPHGITVIPGDVVRVVYSARDENQQLILGRLCSGSCSGPGYVFEDLTIGTSTTPSKDGRIILGSDYPDGGNVFFGGTGLDLVGRMSPERDITLIGTQHPACDRNISAVLGLTYTNGEIWYVDQGCNGLGRLTLATKTVDLFPLDAKRRGMVNITTSSSGYLWITEPLTQTLAAVRVVPGGIKIARVDACETVCVSPDYVVEGPDGNIWFTAPSADEQDFIGRVTMEGVVNLFPVPEPAQLRGIIAAPDGLWFTDSLGRQLGRMNTNGDVDALISIVDDQGVTYAPGPLALGANQDIWFTLPEDNALGRYDPFSAPGGSPAPGGNDGWLAALLASMRGEAETNSAGRIAVGQVSEPDRQDQNPDPPVQRATGLVPVVGRTHDRHQAGRSPTVVALAFTVEVWSPF